MERLKSSLATFRVYHNPREFCERLISAVNIATMYRDDIDQQDDKKRISSIISNERHSKVTPEEITRKWNIGIQTAKDTVQVMTQQEIRTALHPMMQHLCVNHLHLHRQ